MATANLTAGSLGATGRRFDTDLPDDLRGAIRGEVRFNRGSRALYATDGSPTLSTGVPLASSFRETSTTWLSTVGVFRQHGVPILSRGGGTSLAGQCCNAAVVIDMSKYRQSRREHRRGAPDCARGAGVRPRQPAARGGGARAHLRPGPCHSYALHARRHAG